MRKKKAPCTGTPSPSQFKVSELHTDFGVGTLGRPREEMGAGGEKRGEPDSMQGTSTNQAPLNWKGICEQAFLMTCCQRTLFLDFHTSTHNISDQIIQKGERNCRPEF